ncbi:hypothetical protein HYY75_10835 [bacterium]|nr:hypothetical protein [bacterium]
MKLFYLLVFTFCWVILFSSETDAQTPPGTKNSDQIPPREKINVYALFSPEIEEFAKKVSTELKQKEDLETFAQQGLVIHGTLFMTEYPHGKRDEIFRIVSTLASGTKTFPITSTGLHRTNGNWFFLNLERNKYFQKLSDSLCELLSPLRLIDQKPPDWLLNYPQKLKSFEMYGSPNVFGDFEPHITLLANSEEKKLVRFIEFYSSNQRLIGIADHNGQMETSEREYFFTP